MPYHETWVSTTILTDKCSIKNLYRSIILKLKTQYFNIYNLNNILNNKIYILY